MADVFLSYARADRRRAEQVKAALEGAGLSVFFDVEGLDGGDVFPDVLDREVKTAGAVVSLWSPHALSRPWVKQECSIGLKRKCLIPLAIEPLGDLDVPVAFEGLQQIDFTGFHGRTDSAEWRTLMRALARTLKRPELVAGSGVAVPMPGPAGPVRPKPHPSWFVSGGLALLLFITVGILMFMAIENKDEGPVNPAEQVAGVPEELPGGDPVATAEVPTIGPDTDEAGNMIFPVPWLEDPTPEYSCGDQVAHTYFDFDRSAPNLGSVIVLEEALERSFGCLLLSVRIEAHDDVSNSPAYAQALSERRASEVASLLISKGVDGTIISTVGYGSSQPTDTKRTPMNRRADVFFDFEYRPADPAVVFPE